MIIEIVHCTDRAEALAMMARTAAAERVAAYERAVLAECRERLTPEDVALFDLFMAGEIGSDDPRYVADMTGGGWVYRATMRAISAGLG